MSNDENGRCTYCGRDNRGYENEPCSDDCPQYDVANLLASLHGVDELCQQGLNSPHAEHWECALYDIRELVRTAIAKAKGN
jgi:hypothetical protein